MLNDVTVSKYVDAITAEAQEAKLEAEKKISDYKTAQISRFRAEALENSKSEITRRCAVIREDIGREFSVKETKLREQIFIKRDEIKTDVFNRAKNKLIEFTKSDDYKAFVQDLLLTRNADVVSALIPKNDGKFNMGAVKYDRTSHETLAGMYQEIREKEKEAEQIQAQIAEQQAENERLQAVVDGGDEQEYIERVAREKLGYVMPDEKVYYDITPSN